MSIWSVQRIFLTVSTGGIAALLCAQVATAEESAAGCEGRNDVLGVSRVIEVDTTGGLRFGNMQYKDFSFLKEGEVVLTYDDGPLRRNTTAVLNALEAECTKATFFMVGRMAVTDPYTVREIDRRGHTIGTHTWSHKALGRQSKSGAKSEIELGFSAVSAALGRPVAPFFRFPYLSDPNAMISYLKTRNVGIFSIDVDSLDFRTRSGPAMVSRTLTGLKRNGNKGILLFHDIQTSTARGVKALLSKLKRGGYKVVHLVAKEPVATLSSYDEKGERELNRRKKSWSTRPFPQKSVPWPAKTARLPATEPLTYIKAKATAKNPDTSKKSSLESKSGEDEAVSKTDSTQTSSETGEKGARTKKSSLKASKSVAHKKLRPGQYVDPLHSRIYSD